MSLKVEKVDLVDYYNLNIYIEECLGRKWDLQQNEYDANGSLRIYDVYPADEEEKERVKRWLESPKTDCPGRIDQLGDGESVEIFTIDILNVMCEKGFLKEGELYVHICW